MKLTHDYLMALHDLDTKISHMKALLAAPKFKNITINFFTETAPGQPDRYNSINEQNFGFSLSFELVQIFNENIAFLEMQKESLLNNCNDYQTEEELLKLKLNN
jgi:hypothetical protein